ncbi:MAG: hypothetical protein JNM68_06270 [Dinghuibacter sp.]|nr:hypothetical protein [Dinghuibacter sp.]
MKTKTKKLVLKKTTVKKLVANTHQALVGGSRRCTVDASGCAGTFGCCQHTR